jgi:hypothetical protein
MVRLLIRVVVFLASAALGLLAAGLLIPAVTLSLGGFTLAVIVFAVVQSALTALTARIAKQWAPALGGGVGIISTLLALALASLVPGGVQIDTAAGWLLAALVVWLVTALASIALGYLLLREKRDGANGSRGATARRAR